MKSSPLKSSENYMESPMLQICVGMQVVSPIMFHADFTAFAAQQEKVRSHLQQAQMESYT